MQENERSDITTCKIFLDSSHRSEFTFIQLFFLWYIEYPTSILQNPAYNDPATMCWFNSYYIYQWTAFQEAIVMPREGGYPSSGLY